MNAKYILSLNSPKASLELVGGKGESLARLVTARLPVPDGFHITTKAYTQFLIENHIQQHIVKALEDVEDSRPETLEKTSQTIIQFFKESPIPTEVASEILKAYSTLPGKNPAVAVRSSATAEDLPEASFAGQQESYLNISGADAILDATRKCWASLWTARAISYRNRQGISPDQVALAVVVQLLIDAEISGILFTANPLNGNHNQIMVNASWGLGEAVVGGKVTPDTIILDSSDGKIIIRETAEKLRQTAKIDGGTQEEAVPEKLRNVPILSDNQVAELARLGKKIETLYEKPMDIEWLLANGEFAIVQARPITTLPETDLSYQPNWKLPKGAYAAMRNNIVELMTDPLTPLFKTFGLEAVNASMNRMMVNFLGVSGVLPDNPIIVVNEYAYYNGSVNFGPMFKILLDTMGILKRMFNGAIERWTEVGRPKYLEIIKEWEAQEWHELPTSEILDASRQLTEAAIDAYLALVSGVIPASWITEAWFTFTYKFLKRKDDPEAPIFLMGFDSLPIRAEKELFDLAKWVQNQNELAVYLQKTPTETLAEHLKENLKEDSKIRELGIWQDRFQQHLKKFGHMIYNLDFSNPVPADDPAPLIETFKLFLSNQGTNPHERQQKSVEQRESAIATIKSRLKGRRLKAFQKNLARAQKFAPLREDGLADVGLSYPLLRRMLREIGNRLVEAGSISKADQIFSLNKDEIEYAAVQLDQGESIKTFYELIRSRQTIWRSAHQISPPIALPQIKLFGMDLMELKTGIRKKQKENMLNGVGASPGVITAPACVLHSPEDFANMNIGDVLVASLTTPAWTPLFARASAVVTDIGGPLSHGSIVAREYGIPAVLGTGDATNRISDGQVITVDGKSGTVLLINDKHHSR